MIAVPQEIQDLFQQDSVSKNFRVHFPNGEFRDLVNKDFISESVIFTESVSSDGKLRFGISESPSIEFSTYITDDIKGFLITCRIEIDISSLDESFIEQYGETSDDVPFTFYAVDYGWFKVKSCKFDNNNICKVIAVSDKLTEESLQEQFSSDNILADFLKLKLQLGAIYSESVRDYHPVGPGDDAYAKVSTLEFLLAMYPNSNLVTKMLVQTHDVFNICSVSHILKTFFFEVNGRVYFIYVRGRKLIFDDTSYDSYTLNQLDVPIGNVLDAAYLPSPQFDTNPLTSSKVMRTLPYRLDPDYYYEFKWVTSATNPNITRDRFRYPELYDYLTDNGYLDKITSPCLIFKEVSNRPSSMWYTEGDGGDSQSFNYQNEDYNFLFPTTILTNEERFDGIEMGRYLFYTNFVGLNLQDTCDKQIAHQNFVNLDYEVTEDNAKLFKILPNLVKFEKSTPGIVSENIIDEYYEAVNDFTSSNTWKKRPRHIEIGLPDDLLIISCNDLLPDSQYSFRHLPSSANPDVTYTKEIISFAGVDTTHSELTQYQLVSNFVGVDIVPYTNVALKSLLPGYYAGHGTVVPSGTQNPLTSEGAYQNPRPYWGRPIRFFAPYVADIDTYFSNYRLLVDFAEINGLLMKPDRENIKSWKFMSLSAPKLLFPEDDLFPDDDLFPAGINSALYVVSSTWRKLSLSRYRKYPYNKVICTIDDVYYEADVIEIDPEDKDEYAQYDLSDNWFIVNGLVDVQSTLNHLAEMLRKAEYYELNLDMRALPYIESGDILAIVTKDNVIMALNSRQRVKGIQSLIANVENV